MAFPDVAALESAEGLVAGLSTASSMFGVVTLSFWAIATATDYSTGPIRLLASAQPRRWQAVGRQGHRADVVTAVATTVALVTNVGGGADAQPKGPASMSTAWQDDPACR